MANERAIVCGAGGISRAWFPHLVREGVRVAAVVDLRREAAQGRIDEYGLADAVAEDDLARALRDHPADFLLDLTIPDAHHDVTCQALAAGLHVIGEKPMAATMDQARRMVEAAERSGRLFMVSQSRRWDAKHATIARAVRPDGPFGQLSAMHCDFFLAAHFGGFRDEMESPLILDMAIHHFDLARMFAGRDAVSVYAEEYSPAGSWYRGDVAANCLFEMQGGLRFTYRGSWAAEGCHTSWNGDWRFVGTEGTLVYERDAFRGQVVADRSEPKFHLPLRDVTVEPVAVEQTQMAGGLAEMLRFLRTGERPQTECHDNVKSLAMVHAAIRSSREGRRVRVEEV